MISLIFAIDENNLIGKGNDLPWHYPEDLKYFKDVTTGKTVLMGLNTFYSIYNRIGKPLPKRNNLVATLDRNIQIEGVTFIYDLISFLTKEHEEEIFIIGGKQIYELSLPYADRLYITHINKTYDGDVYFPKINYDAYNIIKSINSGELTFNVYERKGDK